MPTAAAHLLGRSWEEAFAKAERLRSVFIYFEDVLRRAKLLLDNALPGILGQISHALASAKDQLNYAERALVSHDPTRQLQLGYALVRQNGQILTSVKGLAKGDKLQTQSADGTVESEVDKIKSNG